MAFEELKEKAADAEAGAKAYVQLSAEYYELKAFKIGMRGILYLIKGVVISLLASLTLVFLSVAGAFALGEALESVTLGFLCVGLIYLILLLLAYLLRNKLNKPIIKQFSTFFYEP
jgi:high-affinity Fe2+/Pb2+ permease